VVQLLTIGKQQNEKVWDNVEISVLLSVCIYFMRIVAKWTRVRWFSTMQTTDRGVVDQEWKNRKIKL